MNLFRKHQNIHGKIVGLISGYLVWHRLMGWQECEKVSLCHECHECHRCQLCHVAKSMTTTMDEMLKTLFNILIIIICDIKLRVPRMPTLPRMPSWHSWHRWHPCKKFKMEMVIESHRQWWDFSPETCHYKYSLSAHPRLWLLCNSVVSPLFLCYFADKYQIFSGAIRDL